MDKYGYIGIETLLNFCENSKDHAVTPNDFMRMKRVRVPERKDCDTCRYNNLDWDEEPVCTEGAGFASGGLITNYTALVHEDMTADNTVCEAEDLATEFIRKLK